MSSRRKRIFFDRTQNERGRIDSTYSELAQILRDNDFDVDPYTEYMILQKKIAECDVLVFGCPNSSKLRQPEIDAIRKFVEKGGGLFLLSLSGGDRGLMNNMSKLGEIFGISFENTAVKDDRNNAGLPTMPIMTDIVVHPATEDVSDLLVPSSCTLMVSGKATVLVRTAETADPPKQPVIAFAEFGKGKVLCSSSYEIFRKGGGLKHPGNRQLAINSFKWLSGEVTTAKPSKVAAREAAIATTGAEVAMPKELEATLRRLVNAVFDLQKDIGKVTKQVSSVDKNLEMLRDQFQDFAERTQQQLGVIIPAKQFKTEDENIAAALKKDIKALSKEIKSVEQLREHIEQRHTSGAMSKESFDEQVKKLDKRIGSLKKKLAKKKKELKDTESKD